MFINQYIFIFDGSINLVYFKYIGSIDFNCNVFEVVKDVYDMVKFLCDKYYMVLFDLEIQEINVVNFKQLIYMVYVFFYFYYMFFEFFKNVMWVIVESYEFSFIFLFIKVMVVLGEEDLFIKMSD